MISLLCALLSIRLLFFAWRRLFARHARPDAGLVLRGFRFIFGGVIPLTAAVLLMLGVVAVRELRTVSGEEVAAVVEVAVQPGGTDTPEDSAKTSSPTETAAAEVATTESSATDEPAAAPGPSTAPTAEADPASLPATSSDESLKTPENTSQPIPAEGSNPATTNKDEAASASSPATSSVMETPEQRKQKLSEVAQQIAPWIRSLLDNEAQAASTGTDPAQAGESSDKKIMVFQLPGSIEQTYAIIRLTPAMDAAVSPMKPLIAAGRLDTVAELLENVLKKSIDESATPGATAIASDIPTATVDISASTGVGTESVAAQAFPSWHPTPDGGRIIAKTTPVLRGEDSSKPLAEALNKAMSEHMAAFADQLEPALRAEARQAKFELDAATVKSCIVDTFERDEQIVTEREGSKPFRIIYALVEFPEAVDKIALAKIRESVQRDRVYVLAIVISLAWLAVCSLGFGIRLWIKGTWIRRTLALPVILVIAFPLLLTAASLGVHVGQQGDTSELPWKKDAKPMQIQLKATT
jgi:hypothetical protein